MREGITDYLKIIFLYVSWWENLWVSKECFKGNFHFEISFSLK